MEERKIALAQMVESVAMGVYQQDKEKGLEQMNGLFGELLKMAKEMETENVLSLNIEVINQVLIEAMKALEARDYVLLADILFYDLKEALVCESGDNSDGAE